MGRRWPLLPLGLLCSATRVGWVQSGVLQKIVKIVKQANPKSVVTIECEYCMNDFCKCDLPHIV